MDAEAIKKLVHGKPCFTIEGPDREPYLTRYYLHKEDELKIYVHQFHRSDQDRDMHCHPWPFTSVILAGGYTEYVPGASRVCVPGDVVRRKAEDCHRVELFQDADGKEIETWTMVYVGKKCRDWGFHTDKGWVFHRDYFDIKFGKGKWHDADEVVQMQNYMED